MSIPPLNVLLIEDNAAHARLVQRHLATEAANVRLSWVDRLATGLDHLRNQPTDAVLLDLGLPDSEPSQTLGKIIAAAPRVPVIILTTIDDRDLAVAAVQQGAQDHLPKAQLSSELLVRAIRYAVHRKGVEEQLKALNNSLEQQVAERTAVAEARAAQLQRLATELSQAEHRERRRLAQSLHDGLQQLLVAAKMRLGTIGRKAQDPTLQGLVDGVYALLDQSIQASRDLTLELCPPILASRGLGPALRWLAEQMQQVHALNVKVAGSDLDLRLSTEVSDFLFQAVRELLFNVVKHAGVSDALISVDTLDDDTLRIRVTDRGRGIDVSALERGATGERFGLFSIRQRLELLGGRLTIDSAPGRGTSATLTTPMRAAQPTVPDAHAAAPPREGPLPPPGDAPAEAIRVLVVDDHKVVREGLVGLLNNEDDIEVVGQAADGESAVRAAAALSPDVVLMDINLPGISGVEATRRIVAATPDARVIGLSMNAGPHVENAMRAAGAVAYVSKGDAATDLLSVIRSHRPTTAPRR